MDNTIDMPDKGAPIGISQIDTRRTRSRSKNALQAATGESNGESEGGEPIRKMEPEHQYPY
jgi:hypothetical protein